MNSYGDCFKCKSFSKSALACLKPDIISNNISSSSVSINYKKGQEVYLEGSLSKGVFCIQSGKVKVYKKCIERNITIALAGNSDLLGYQSIFNGDKYTHSAKCLEDSHICFIPKNAFLETLAGNNEMLMHLTRQSCIENYKLSNILRDLKCKNMLNRISCALLTVADKYGYDENKCLNITLTRKEIAEISGTTTESAIRILNDLKKEKVISFYNSRIKIQDANKLNGYK